MFQHIPVQWKISINKATCTKKEGSFFDWLSHRTPFKLLDQIAHVLKIKAICSCSSLFDPLPFCQESWKKSLICMHPKWHHLPISSWPPNSVYSFISGYTFSCKLYWGTVLGLTCGLDQLSHHTSTGTIHVTPVHREHENGSTGLFVLPHRWNYIPSFNFHGCHPPLLTNTHLKTDSPASYTSGKHK